MAETGLDTTIDGQVTIDTTGNVTVQLTGAMASSTLTVQFCPAIDASTANANAPGCINVTTISTDASGNGSATAMFPQPGDWAGDFYLDSGTKAEYQTYLYSGINHETFMATLEPTTTTNGGWDTSQKTQDPITSGTVTYANGTVTFTVTGGEPSTAYQTTESETYYIDSSGTYALNSFTTDAKGDATSSTQLSGGGGDMFQVYPESNPTSSTGPAGYIDGFSVPKP